jgi:ribosomal biogenesis protein LAS1
MVQFLFTPWRHRGELLLVRAQFYPHSCQRSNEEERDRDRDSADRLQRQRQRQRRRDHQSSRESGRLSSSSGGGGGDDGKDTDGRQQAVDRVSMWMQRGGCPHLVESTAVLTAAALSDEEFMSRAGSDWSGWRSYEVRLAYSTAFGRYVFFRHFSF